MSEHGLRDLARQIDDLARRHPSYAQAAGPVGNLLDHLQAIAGFHEHTYRLAGEELPPEPFVVLK